MKLKQYEIIFHVVENGNSIVQQAKRKWNCKTCQCECTNYRTFKMITVGVLDSLISQFLIISN